MAQHQADVVRLYQPRERARARALSEGLRAVRHTAWPAVRRKRLSAAAGCSGGEPGTLGHQRIDAEEEMNARHLCCAIGLMAFALIAHGQAAQSSWTPPRTPEGHPDFQGVW